MKLNKIYKRTSTGKVQEWEIEIEENKFRTISGQKDGKKITNKWTVCNGKNIGKKNETSPVVQALKEAQAKRRKKLEGEYFENIEAVDEMEYTKPMLAKEYADYSDVTEFPLWCQPKLDGIRAETRINTVKSRNGKFFVSVPHIREALEPVFQDFPHLEFDGELYNHEYKDDFNAITSIVKRQKISEEDLQKSKKYIQYWVYDLIDSTAPKRIFSERFEFLQSLFNKYLVTSTEIIFVPTFRARTLTELNKYYEQFLNDGYEGQMIRTDEPYEFKRSRHLLKRKEFQTEEFPVIDIAEGIGNRTGTAGYIVTITEEGKEFRSNIKGSFPYLKKILKNKKKYIGKEATIRFFRYTPDKIPRFPFVIAFDRQEYE